MTKVILSIGVPASGKTTALKAFADQNGYAYISSDGIRVELTGDITDQSRNKDVWAEAYRRTKDFLERGENVVFDATFSNPDQRREFIDFVRNNGADKVQGIFLDVSLETAQERNRSRERVVPDYVLERMHQSIKDSPPRIEDGFDSVFTLDEYQELLRAELAREGEDLSKEFKKRS